MNWSNDFINDKLGQMAHQLEPLLKQHADRPIHLVGIHTGGVWVAEALNQKLGTPLPLSTLATNYYRDDFQKRGMKTGTPASDLPTSLDDAIVILVDDVLMSGRTIRAAINELFDYGRPARVYLVILFDVGQRELPVQADICGERIAIEPLLRLQLHGPSPLTASLIAPEGTQQ